MYLFELASRHMTWLAERQAVTAANIANADTPDYRAQGVRPFSAYLETPAFQMAATDPKHMALPAAAAGGALRTAGESWAAGHSGNNVSIERELMTASTSNRMMSVDASLTRSFHRMFLSSVKV